MNKNLAALVILFLVHFLNAQPSLAFADSIRKAYNIPELGYAVISSTQVYELQHSASKK